MGSIFASKIVYLGELYSLSEVSEKDGRKVAVYEGEENGVLLNMDENLYRYHEAVMNIVRRNI